MCQYNKNIVVFSSMIWISAVRYIIITLLQYILLYIIMYNISTLYTRVCDCHSLSIKVLVLDSKDISEPNQTTPVIVV